MKLVLGRNQWDDQTLSVKREVNEKKYKLEDDGEDQQEVKAGIIISSHECNVCVKSN